MPLRPFRLPGDLKTLVEIIPPAFQYPENDAWSMQPGEVESFVGEINGLRRIWPLLLVAAAVSPAMRDTFRGYVWEEDGRLVGSANVIRQGATDLWYIGNVAVLPEYRRRGIARRLVEACIDLARKRGARTVLLDVVAGNTPAVSLYERLGFEHFSGQADLTLDAQSAISPVALPEGARLVLGAIFDWEPRYTLARRITPQSVQRYAPVEEAGFRRPAGLRVLVPVIRLATGVSNHSLTLRDAGGDVVATGMIAARRRPVGVNYLSLMLDPSADALGPALIAAAVGEVRRISPGRQIDMSVPHWQNGLIEAGLAAGFTRRLDEHTMGLHVQAGRVMAAGESVYVRDRFTWLAYAMLAYYAYLQAALGPLMPFLRDELGLSYTLGGLHFSALALGMVMAGLSADRAVCRWGRRSVFWAGGAGMAVGALAIALGPHPALTVGGSWIMGYLGTFVLALVQSSLADRHGSRRAVALTEANVGASISVALCPLLVGGFQRAGIGWQGALVVAAGAWAASLLVFRGEPFPEQNRPAPGAGGRSPALPLNFWVYWMALILCVAAEWSIVSWGADFLVNPGGLGKSDASMVMTFFFGAMVIGRAFGSRLSRVMDSARLLLAAIGVALAGFVVFWLTPVVGLRIGGLFVAGLGVSNLFPFLMAIAVGVGAAQSDAASARVTLGAGLAILVAPQTLGWVADQVDLKSALSIVFGLLVVAAAVTALANRRVARHNGVPSVSSAGR